MNYAFPKSCKNIFFGMSQYKYLTMSEVHHFENSTQYNAKTELNNGIFGLKKVIKTNIYFYHLY